MEFDEFLSKYALPALEAHTTSPYVVAEIHERLYRPIVERLFRAIGPIDNDAKAQAIAGSLTELLGLGGNIDAERTRNMSLHELMEIVEKRGVKIA